MEGQREDYLVSDRILRRGIERPSDVLYVFQNWLFGKQKCFLCACDLQLQPETDEHVIPKWVQNAFNLFNQRLVLPNGTSIPYRQLTVPCCTICNSEHLGGLEKRISQAAREGFEGISQLDSWELFLWLVKLHYGLQYKDHLVPLERSVPASLPLLEPEFLRRIEPLHLLLQMIRLPINFVGQFPASIFLFEVQTPKDIPAQFDFRDSLVGSTIAVILGNIGIIGCLGDRGATSAISEGSFDYLRGKRLHPLQFWDLAAQIFYKNSLQKWSHPFESLENPDLIGGTILSRGLASSSTIELYEDWEAGEYNQLLASFTQRPDIADNVVPEGLSYTFLKDPLGRFEEMILDD